MAACSHINPTTARPPNASASVHKEECTLCFDNWESSSGIFVCSSCYNGGCEQHARLHAEKRNHPLAVKVRRFKKAEPSTAEPPQKITKVAIGVPGGVSIDTEENYAYDTSIHCFACAGPVEASTMAPIVDAIMAATSASRVSDQAAWSVPLEPCEHTLTLEQDPSAKLAKKGESHCGECEIKDSLWLCMTCGHLGCPRKQYELSGVVGGNAHGVSHYEQTGHPVVCKSGTISPEGADLFCYKCDEAKVDLYLKEHLAFFGIDISTMEKTEKSTAELELDRNLSLDLSTTHEGGQRMKPLFGPGFTGLKNLGNTCYMASVLQVAFSLPNFQSRYGSLQEHQVACQSPPESCFLCQMGKLADGLLSGRYSQPPADANMDADTPVEQVGIPPRMLKTLICRGHPEFSTVKQQDAYEFFQHLLKTIKQKEHATGVDPTAVVQYSLQQRLQCTRCKGVRYSTEKQTELSVSIPVSLANPPLKAVEGEKADARETRETLSHVPLAACIDASAADESIDGFRCPNCQQNVTAVKCNRFETFPDVLALHARRFVYEDWMPHKLAVQLDVPDVLDLSHLVARGQQPDETPLPGDKPAAQAKPTFNQADVETIMSMGFSRVRAERALHSTGNSGAEAAMNWLFEHMDDPDIDTPLPSASAASKGGAEFAPELIGQLSEMGFQPAQAKRALRETDGNVERALEWLFSHMDELQDITDEPASAAAAPSSKADMEVDSRPARYELLGFIVHLGPSVHSGHYVAFVKRNGQWVQFNDEKVAVSENPPIGKAYMYFFKRF
eukprot:TRINITY_DN7315_c0_g1_i1.p1 TRINITY_DN7315_c0_g1~~TRINITY_DN7315_c0_g1_i1.p1  ORF type:complete len:786 (+),score=243.20 TRINITY_DN7315_c0_g1_i1:82-2439(+)